MILGCIKIPCKYPNGSVINTRQQMMLYHLNDSEYAPCGSVMPITDNEAFTKIKLIERYPDDNGKFVYVERYFIYDDVSHLYPFAMKVFKEGHVELYVFNQHMDVIKEQLTGNQLLHESLVSSYLDRLVEMEYNSPKVFMGDTFFEISDYIFNNRNILNSLSPISSNDKIYERIHQLLYYACERGSYSPMQFKCDLDDLMIPSIVSRGKVDPITRRCLTEPLPFKDIFSSQSIKPTGFSLSDIVRMKIPSELINVQCDFKESGINTKIYEFFVNSVITDMYAVFNRGAEYKVNYGMTKYCNVERRQLEGMLDLLDAYIQEIFTYLPVSCTIHLVKTFKEEVYLCHLDRNGKLIAVDYIDLLLVLLNTNAMVVWP